MTRRGFAKATIYDIAREAALSPSTVSLILNGRWQKYRIREATAERVLGIARSANYSADPQARGLRLAQSGLGAMILPHFRNFYYTNMVEAFEAGARARGYCPLVASTQRDPAIQAEAVRTLIRQKVDFLFLVGLPASDPVVAECDAAGIRTVCLDLPGSVAPSVVTDSRTGARELTRAIIDRLPGGAGPEDIVFIGGVVNEYATDHRVKGFLEIAGGAPDDPGRIRRCGYDPDSVRAELHRLFEARGSLPPALFINSAPAFEAVAQFLLGHERARPGDAVLGCFDWNPLGAYVPGLVGMVRHDVRKMTEAAFGLLTDYPAARGQLVTVMPEFCGFSPRISRDERA